MFSVKISAFIHPQIQKVDIGKSVVLKCVMSGGPFKFVKWFKDGVLVKEDVAPASTSVFSIPVVETSSKGMYQCFVGNEMEVKQASGQLFLSGLYFYY